MFAPGLDTQQIHPVYTVNSAPVLFEEHEKRVDKLEIGEENVSTALTTALHILVPSPSLPE